MKKLITLIVALFTISVVSKAETPVFEDYDYSQEFAQLDELESYLEQNKDVTYETLHAERADLVEDISLSSDLAAFVNKDMPILGPFWWGCCLSLVGVLLVYIITDHDRDQVKKALLGCLITFLVFGANSLIWGWF